MQQQPTSKKKRVEEEHFFSIQVFKSDCEQQSTTHALFQPYIFPCLYDVFCSRNVRARDIFTIDVSTHSLSMTQVSRNHFFSLFHPMTQRA